MKLGDTNLTPETVSGAVLTYMLPAGLERLCAQSRVVIVEQYLSGMVRGGLFICQDLQTGEQVHLFSDTAFEMECHQVPAGGFKTVKQLREFVAGWFPGVPLGGINGHGCSLSGMRHYDREMSYDLSINHRSVFAGHLMQMRESDRGGKADLLNWANGTFAYRDLAAAA